MQYQEKLESLVEAVRIPHAAYRPTFVRSLLMTPIRTIEPIGAIGSYWAQHHIPSADEMHLLQTLANATSLENIQMHAELEQRVIDPADTPGASLSELLMQADAAMYAIKAGKPSRVPA